MADKQRVLNEIDKLVPDDFVCGHIEITFKDDDAVVITLNNKEETDEMMIYGLKGGKHA